MKMKRNAKGTKRCVLEIKGTLILHYGHGFSSMSFSADPPSNVRDSFSTRPHFLKEDFLLHNGENEFYMNIYLGPE